MPKEVEALRASLDSRLTALEKALADPKQHGSLESLILDLARIATEEADATTRQAVLAAQKAGHTAAAAARTEAASALEAERGESDALRQVIDQAKAALKQAEAALKDERRASEAATRDAAGLQRELTAARTSLEQEQTARASERRELDTALSAVEAERARAASVEHQIARAHAEAESQFAALASDLEQYRVALEQERAAAAQLSHTSSKLQADLATVLGELSTARTELDSTRNALDTSRAELDAARRDFEAARGEVDAARAERDAMHREFDAVRRELDGVRHDAEARTQTLSHSQAEQEQAIRTAQDAARDAEARFEQTIRERDAIQNENLVLKQQLEFAASAVRERDALKEQLVFAEGAIRERDALKRELQAAHEARDAAEMLAAARNTEPGAPFEFDVETVVDLTSVSKEEERQLAIENRIRALELALRDAETRAEAAELELDLQRRAAPSDRGTKLADSTLPPPSTTPEQPEQFRGPARAAKRVAFKGEFDIQVDGTPGKLVDMSITGAQLLTPSAMKPNRLIKVTFPMGDTVIACKAKVMWSRLEPRAGQLWYRAGVSFTSADQIALEAFLSAHQK